MPYDESADPETYALIGAAIAVHRWFGPGYLEAVYHRAMAIELRRRGLPFRKEVPFPLSYHGEDLGVAYRADLVCGTVLVELKATAGLADHDIAQVVHYLRSSGLSKGLLLNFGLPVLQKRRVVVDWPSDSMGSVRSVTSAEASKDATMTRAALP